MVHNEFFAFETAQKSDVGCKREINEDSFLPLPEAGLWVVADGMGGHTAGDFASQTIVRELVSIGLPTSGDDLQARFMDRLYHSNDLILDHAAELGTGTIGSTVVALLVHGDAFACIWAGDSRIYRMRNGHLEQLTKDHTEVRALLETGAITPEQAENWPRKNVITRAVGVTDDLECEVMGGGLLVGDTFVLCSDGLMEHVADHEIAAHLDGRPLQATCDALIALTLSRGARDNVTVVCMRVHDLPPPSEAELNAPMEDFW